MRIFTSLFLFLLFYCHVFSQTTTLTGKVTNSKKESLPGVTVLADNATRGTVTDINGNYSLPLDSGKHTILFKMIGMKEKIMPVYLEADKTSILNVTLSESARELGVVVVSAGKYEQKIEDVTVSMNVISPSLVEDKNTTSMEKILNQIPSVSIIDGQANIRGGSGWSYGAGSRVLMLVDDLPMLTADANDTKWQFLPLENLQQIEVIKGASSALYGSSALNGVINFRTAYPKDTPETRVNLYTGVYDNRRTIKLNDTTYDLNWNGKKLQKYSGVNFFHSRQINNLDLVFGGNAFTDDGYREGEYEQRARFNVNTRYRFRQIDGLSCGVNFNTQITDESLFFIWQNDTTGAYLPKGGVDTPSTTLSQVNTYRTNIDPFITYADKNGNTHKIRTRYFHSNNIDNTNQNSTADLYYGEYQYQKQLGSNKSNPLATVTGGIVGEQSKVKSQLYSDHTGSNLAAYFQTDAHWKKINFSVGGRLEKNKIDSASDKVTPVVRAGINYPLFEATHLRASYGQGYRYPSIAEKYISTTVGGLRILPNDSLKSEKGYSTEVGVMQGIKVGGWKGYFDVAAFYTRYDSMIEFTFGFWNYKNQQYLGFKGLNIGSTQISGLDFTLSGEGNIGPVGLSVLAGYTYMVPKAISFDSSYIKAQHIIDASAKEYKAYLGSDSSNFLKYRFQHLVKADVGFSYQKYSLGFSLQYNSYMKNIDALFTNPSLGAIVTPGVRHYRLSHQSGDAIYDLRTGYQLTSTTKLSFIVKNVFNYIYMQRPADMQPPRTFAAQLTVAF